MTPARRWRAGGVSLLATVAAGSAWAQGGDDPSVATPIGTKPAVLIGTTEGLTDQFDVVCPFTGSTSPDAWYRLTAPTDNELDLSLCESAYDTKLYVLDASFNVVACNDDACTSGGGGAYRSALQGVEVTEGETYFIVVDGWSGSSGAYELEIDPGPEPCRLEPAPGDRLEDEACGPGGGPDLLNGGCADGVLDPVVFAVECGDRVFGATWGLDGEADRDWFRTPSASLPTVMRADVVAEFPVRLRGWVSASCDRVPSTVASVVRDRCTPGHLFVRLEPGEAADWSIHASTDGLECGGTGPNGHEYLLEWRCVPLEACLFDGDVDDDFEVDTLDILLVMFAYGNSGDPADIDGSGEVDFVDLLIVLSDFGSVCGGGP